MIGNFTNLEGTGKDTYENITSGTMQAQIITILIDKLLVFSNATTSKAVALWI